MIKKAKVTVVFEVENIEEENGLEGICRTLATDGRRGPHAALKPKILSIKADVHQVIDIEPL